jgi:hypothetical protein
VIEVIVVGFSELPPAYFEEHIPFFYGFFVKLLKFGMGNQLHGIFERVGTIYHIPKRNLSRYPAPTLFPSLESLINDMELDELAGALVTASLKGSVDSLLDKDVDPFAQPQ